MTTTLFVDLGRGLFAGDGTTVNPINTTVGAFRDIFEDPGFQTGINNTGSDLSGIAGLIDTDSLDFQPLNYDWNGDATFDINDVLALEAGVIPIIERALEPFDIDVVTGSASNLGDALTAVQGNTSDPTGEHDAYIFAMNVTSDRFSNGSVGNNARLFGITAARDLIDQSGNDTDEAALTFADTIFNFTNGVQGTQQFNNNLAFRLAYTITHEAFHTFTYRHTPDESSTVPRASANERLLASGDVIRLGSVTREDPFIVTRFDLLTALEPVNGVNNYEIAVFDPDIGLRDDDADGTPNLAYSTGTGAHDRITLGANGSSVDVTVDAFNDVPRVDSALIRSESYSINLSTDTEGEILVDASINSDEVVVDASIGAELRLRGGEGRDRSVSVVAEADRLTLQSNGFSGTYTPGADPESGTVNYVGGAQIDFSEFEEVEADNIPILVNPLILSSSSIEENESVNLSGSFINIDTNDGHEVVIDWGDGTTSTFNLAAGLRTFNASHTYEDDGPSPGNNTPEDLHTIQVTVIDEENDSGQAQEQLLVKNVAPIIDPEIDVKVTVIDDEDDGDDDDGDDNEGLLITIKGTFFDPGSRDVHELTALWSDGFSVDVDIDLGARTFTISRFLSEDKLEDNFPEIDDDEDDDNIPGLGDDDIYKIGVNLTIGDDDTGKDEKPLEFFVSEEGGIFVPEIV